jgi:hypothetical protein
VITSRGVLGLRLPGVVIGCSTRQRLARRLAAVCDARWRDTLDRQEVDDLVLPLSSAQFRSR